jgi:hypothetical protein
MDEEPNDIISQSDAEQIRLKRLAKLQTLQANSGESSKPANEQNVGLALSCSLRKQQSADVMTSQSACSAAFLCVPFRQTIRSQTD